MSSRNDAWSVPGPIQHQVLHALNQLGPATPEQISQYIGVREGSVRAALSGMRTMFARHWIKFTGGRAMDTYEITDAGQRALCRAGPCMTAEDALETEIKRREARKRSQEERRLERIAEGLRWRAEIEERQAHDRYTYLKRFWDSGQLFENLYEEFFSLQQRFEPTMSDQPIKYRRNARVLIEVEVPYDQPEGGPLCVAVPNRSNNPTQVTVPAKAIRDIVSQPLRPGDAVRVYNDEDETYITGTLVGKVEGTDQLLINTYHKAVDDKLPQLFEARHVRYDGAA